ncbi:Papain-like cysteine peptidase superfamily [Abeliophyllum distichum]|uniref:Papain-like cysteine peptidase superfamily n=1 Tax=Abeliophyllum distichum TaxID=126358 RepID=A0ABD1Q4P8_9LAMI
MECEATPVIPDEGRTSTGSVVISILCDIDKKIESDFSNWMDRAKSRDVIRLPNGYTLSKQMLQNLGDPQFALKPKNMDNAMMLIRARSVNFSDIFSDKYAILDSGFESLIIHFRTKTLDPRGQFVQLPSSSSSSSSSSVENTMLGYVNGYNPKNFAKQWKDCNYLLWPYLIDNKCWVLFYVDFKSWKLTLIDNNQRFYDDASIYPHVAACINVLPEVIHKYMSSQRQLGKKKI